MSQQIQKKKIMEAMLIFFSENSESYIIKKLVGF